MTAGTVQTRIWGPNPRRLTQEQADRVRALPWERGSLARLSREFGVTPAALWNIRYGYTYKRPWLEKTYVARITDNGQRLTIGTFLTPEAARHAADNFKRTNKWPRGAVERHRGRYRARLSLGVYDTYWQAERANSKALDILSAAQDL